MMKSYTYRDRDAGSHGNGAVRDITRKIEEIMETVPKGGSLPSKELMRRIGCQSGLFYRALDELSREGAVTVDGGHRVHPVEETIETGKIVSISRGFAFASFENREGDAFVHGSRLNGAFLGDRVELWHIRPDEKGLSASVRRVLEKADRHTTGTIQLDYGDLVLQCDSAVRYPLPLMRPYPFRVKVGDKVQAELIPQRPGSDRMQARLVKSGGAHRRCVPLCAHGRRD